MADRVHSADARRASSGNPDDHSTPSRRALLGAIVTVPIVAGSLATAANAGARDGDHKMNMYTSIVAERFASSPKDTFAERLAKYRKIEAEFSIAVGLEASEAETNEIYARTVTAYNSMMNTPAPHAGAVAEKLEALLVEADGAEIGREHLLPVIDDLRRLASTAG